MARGIVRAQNTLLFLRRPWSSSIPLSVPHPRIKNRLALSYQTEGKVCRGVGAGRDPLPGTGAGTEARFTLFEASLREVSKRRSRMDPG